MGTLEKIAAHRTQRDTLNLIKKTILSRVSAKHSDLRLCYNFVCPALFFEIDNHCSPG